MQEFSLHDKVIYTSGNFGSTKSNPLHKDYPDVIGEIIEIHSGVQTLDYSVEWSNGKINGYDNEDLEFINSYNKQKQKLKV